jgi:hypothetical protein
VNESVVLQHRTSRLQQEVESLRRQVEWLETEVNDKTKLVMETRREKVSSGLNKVDDSRSPRRYYMLSHCSLMVSLDGRNTLRLEIISTRWTIDICAHDFGQFKIT